MQVFPFLAIARSERTARRFLLEACRAAHPLDCPACGELKVYEIEGGDRRRCSRCGYSFDPFKGRWFGAVKISARKWLWVAKLFELNMPASVIAAETGISYPTVLKALDVVRTATAGLAVEPFGECRGDGPSPDESIIGSIRTPIEGVHVFERLVPGAIHCVVRLAGGRLVCAERSVPFASLSYAGEDLLLVDRGERFPRWKIYSSAHSGFWPFAKERLAKHHGVSDGKLALYIGELAFRFMNRDRQLFDVIIERLAARVPRRETAVPAGSLEPPAASDTGCAGRVTR